MKKCFQAGFGECTPRPHEKRFLIHLGLVFAGWIAALTPSVHGDIDSSDRPNIIFIATDDLNDWIDPLVSDRAVTPNLDRLAARGVTFTNAHAPGVYCAPSRTAIFTGRFATTTGAYRNQVYFRDDPDLRPLHVAFQESGYRTFGTGKLFHHPAGFLDLRGWNEFFVRTEAQRLTGWPMDSWEHGAPLPDPYPASPFNQADEDWSGRPWMEYGPLPNDAEPEMADTIRTQWACDIIGEDHDEPFFLALGLYAPHFPNYVPQKYFDLYPLESIELPVWNEEDVDDLPDHVRRRMLNRKEHVHDRLIELGIVKETMRGYLAAVTYADAMIGRVLDALEASPYNDNTIVVIWSDHGFHFGEKFWWGKHTLWNRTTRVPFLWAGPGVAKGEAVDATVSLIDLFPTFVDLCGLRPDPGLEGESLKTALRTPEAAVDREVFVPFTDPGSYAVLNREWRYIRYQQGGEELYNRNDDPHEWHNLADDPQYQPVIEQLNARAPKDPASPGPESGRMDLVTDGEDFHWVLR